ncbi:hypothetical protein LZ31DRAFT_327739 [Colletotrichum somersetense]|nr:hypothetical protein LZ31DRAFT_327739 [Colletotrichum somersetense]
MRWTSFWASRRTRHQTRGRENDQRVGLERLREPRTAQHWLQVYSEDCLNSIKSFPAAVRMLVWLFVYGSLFGLSLKISTLAKFLPLFFFSCFLLNPASSRFLGSGTLQSNHTPGRSSLRISFQSSIGFPTTHKA